MSEEDLNIKRLMEQSIPFHLQNHLIRDIYGQWLSGKILSDKQKNVFIATLNQLQLLTWRHGLACECGKHSTIYETLRVLSAAPIFMGRDGIQYSPRRGNIIRLPLPDAVAMVMRHHADWKITEALEPEKKKLEELL
jgi:hypothetical protein